MSSPAYRLRINGAPWTRTAAPLPVLLDELHDALEGGAASARLEHEDGVLVVAVYRHAHAPRHSWLRG